MKLEEVMKRFSAALSMAVLALMSLIMSNTALADIAPDNVQGNWTIYSTNTGNGDTVVKHVQIAQYGDRITGYFEGPVQSGPIQGEIKGHNIRFSTVTRNVLHFSGQIYGDQMSGTYGLHGKHAPWQAVRATTPATLAPPSTGTVYQSQPVLVPSQTQTEYQYPNPAAAPAPQSEQQPTTSYAPQTGSQPTVASQPTPAALSADQLDSMVAPIALYPDALIAQVLAAATNPDQVAYADDWLQQNKNLTGSALAQAVDQQPWDPSVKALTQFPSVLDNLAHNLSWTSSLGQAFANQQNDVMAAVQAMRAKAQAAGTLQSSSQVTVTQPTPTTIVIQPANPQVVYIPQYNPAIVFGAPVVVPLYVPPPIPVASVGLYFGSGITIGAVFGGGGWGGGLGWGWHAWGVNWGCCGGGGSTTIIYNHNTYINNHTWNNTHYNGYHPGTDTHYGPNGGYHPNGYFGPNGGWHNDVPRTGPANQPNGGANGNHGLIGGNGGVQHQSGSAPAQNQPNGGQNGDHGLIGGNGGVQRSSNGWNKSGSQLAQNRTQDNHFAGAEQNRSRFSGNGASNRAESNRGWNSMAGRRSQPHMAREHMPAARSFGGGGRRR
jgi:hypothetical protein